MTHPVKTVSQRIRDHTARGERATAKFLSACLDRGLIVASPVPDTGFDAILYNPNTQEMWRIQVKTAFHDKQRYWLGTTHRKRGRYAPGLIHRYVFARPDGSGFWIVDGQRLESRTGLMLKDEDWERWELFGLKA